MAESGQSVDLRGEEGYSIAFSNAGKDGRYVHELWSYLATSVDPEKIFIWNQKGGPPDTSPKDLPPEIGNIYRTCQLMVVVHSQYYDMMPYKEFEWTHVISRLAECKVLILKLDDASLPATSVESLQLQGTAQAPFSRQPQAVPATDLSPLRVAALILEKLNEITKARYSPPKDIQFQVHRHFEEARQGGLAALLPPEIRDGCHCRDLAIALSNNLALRMVLMELHTIRGILSQLSVTCASIGAVLDHAITPDTQQYIQMPGITVQLNLLFRNISLLLRFKQDGASGQTLDLPIVGWFVKHCAIDRKKALDFIKELNEAEALGKDSGTGTVKHLTEFVQRINTQALYLSSRLELRVERLHLHPTLIGAPLGSALTLHSEALEKDLRRGVASR